MYAFNWALTAFRSESYIGSATALPDTVSHSSSSVHYWPCPVLSAKEMRSMKAGSACVRALLRCVRRRLAKGVLFVATRVCPRRGAIAGHVIKLKLTRRGNTLSSMERRPFPVYRRCGVDAVSQCACLNKKKNNNQKEDEHSELL